MIPDAAIIVLAVYGIPFAFAGVLYGLEWAKDRVVEYGQRRAVNKRLDGLR